MQFRIPTPAAWAGGFQRAEGMGLGGGVKLFSGLWGIFWIPCSILSILTIHMSGGYNLRGSFTTNGGKWGEMGETFCATQVGCFALLPIGAGWGVLRGLERSGVDPSLCSSRARLHMALIAISLLVRVRRAVPDCKVHSVLRLRVREGPSP